jgi:glycosyltransferase involved in cell wall biosynthesis
MTSVSVVCATIDRAKLVERAVTSIRAAARAADVFAQVIIVDQSADAECMQLIDRFSDPEFIVLHSKVRGLSVCRNIGLERATGVYTMFWDADCIMDPEFFLEFKRLTAAHPEAGLFYGSIKCPVKKHDVFREWPKAARVVNSFYRWQISTSVNCVWRNNDDNRGARLDERFGIGARYGSCEDVDFFLQLKGDAVYSPDLVVYHPDQDVNDVPIEKSSAYSFGFGALCRKHFLNYGVTYLALTIMKKVYQVARGRVRLSTGAILIKERLRGFAVFT